MKKLMIIPLLAALAGCQYGSTDQAADRQAKATRTSMDAADRETGMPRIVHYAQRKLLKNAYEDMDQTTLTYAYIKSEMTGKFTCLGQALGYGVSLGTQFTASQYPQYIQMPGNVNNLTEMMDQPEPNGLYAPKSGDATIVDLINPKTGEAHTALIEDKVNTIPFPLPDSVVQVPCPADIDPAKVRDVKEESKALQTK